MAFSTLRAMPAPSSHRSYLHHYKDLAGGVRRDYLTDALGSVTATVTGAGVVENTYRYKPYGETLAKTGTGSDPKFLWNGNSGYRMGNSPSKELYIRARYYSVLFANWIMRDKFWPVERGYLYAYNNPILFVDYNGLFPQKQKKPFVSANQQIPYPGYIPKPYEGDEKQRQKACSHAVSHDIDHGNNLHPGFGGNICWDGKIYPCVHYRGDKCVEKCVMAHELDHWHRRKKIYSCPEQQEACYVDPAPGLPQKDPYWQERDECLAYKVTADCLNKCCTKLTGKCHDVFMEVCSRMTQYCSIVTPSIGIPPYIVNACKKRDVIV